MANNIPIKDILSNIIVEEDMENIFQRDIPFQYLYGKTILVTGATGMLASYLIYFIMWLNEKKQANVKIVALARNRQKCLERFGEYLNRDYFDLRLDDICGP